jgi:plastocyanin
MPDKRTRRTLLSRGAITVAGVVTLAGCLSEDDMSGGDSEMTTAEPTKSSTSTVASETPTADHTVIVAPNGNLVFEPAQLTLAPGEAVEWIWDTNLHSVTVDATPSGSVWSGTGESTHEEGFTHRHTFDVAGSYEYHCSPHQGSGMIGTLQVGNADTATSTPGRGGANNPY